MIKNCNNTNLGNSKVDSKYYLFYQLWKELTAKKTLDTYQFRIMNTLSAIKELKKVINQYLNGYHRGTQNIDDCKSETMEIIKKDMVLQEFYPVVRTRLLSHLNGKLEKDAQRKVLLYQLDYALKIVKPDYFEKIVDSLERSIDRNDVFEIMNKTNQLVSCCSDKGWSNEALHNVIATLHESKEDSSLWETFKGKLCGVDSDEYHILLPFKIRVINAPGQKKESAKEKVLNEIRSMGIEVLKKNEIVSRYSFLDEKKIERNQVYLLKVVSSHDVYSASHLAISQIADTLNILSFYGLTESWNIRDISWFAINPHIEYSTLFKSKDLYSTYDYLEGATRIFRASRELDEYASENVRNKLRATYSYANMGKASYSQNEKYMNTWVALESLCRTEMYENIIDNVLDTVPPALCLRYIYKCFRNFVEDCIRCEVNFEFSSESVNLRHPSKEKVVKDVIRILNDDIIYQELLEKCSINDLLVERCKEMHGLATDGYKMFDKIDRQYLNVKRQLSRLYRFRNEIAHSALNDGMSLIRYIEHLDDYLTDFVAEIVLCWEKNKLSSIEEIFEIIKDNYREYADIRASKKEANPLCLLDKLRKSGIISLI